MGKFNIYQVFERDMVSLEKDELMFEYISKNEEVFNEVAQEICNAIKQGDFSMKYQPSIKNGICYGAEALFRLKIDDFTFNPLAVFTIASYYGFENQLTLKALNKVCEFLKNNENKLRKDFTLSFNVNPKLINTEFCNKIIDILNKNKVNKSNFAIELTEVSTFDNLNVADLVYLKNNGLKLYCDDFGNGYTDERALDLPFDVVKFAGYYINNIMSDPKCEEFLARNIKICKERNMKTIAENVEEKEQAEKVYNLGIDLIQGYYYSKPLSEENFIEKYGIKFLDTLKKTEEDN